MDTKKYYYNMDLCRIISMLGILSLHYNLSGVLSNCRIGTPSWWTAWIIEIGTFWSVNVFAMLSGYLGYKKEITKTYRIVQLLSIVIFYSLLITGICSILLELNRDDIILGLFPASRHRLWYITCFVPVFLLQPYVNIMLNSLTIEQHKRIAVILIVVIGIIPSLIRTDLFNVNAGMSFVWLMTCYISGAYIGRSGFKIKKSYSIWIFMLGFVGQFGIKVLHYFIRGGDTGYMLEYNSPFVVAMGMGVFFFFMNISINRIRAQKSIQFFASFSFDVYILHAHPIVFDKILEGKFNALSESPFKLLGGGIRIYINRVYWTFFRWIYKKQAFQTSIY